MIFLYKRTSPREREQRIAIRYVPTSVRPSDRSIDEGKEPNLFSFLSSSASDNIFLHPRENKPSCSTMFYRWSAEIEENAIEPFSQSIDAHTHTDIQIKLRYWFYLSFEDARRRGSLYSLDNHGIGPDRYIDRYLWSKTHSSPLDADGVKTTLPVSVTLDGLTLQTVTRGECSFPLEWAASLF